MEGNKGGVVFVVIVLIMVAIGFSLMLNPPTVKSFSLPPVPSKGVKHYENITIYADALGWDYGHGTLNPTISIANNTVVNFTVIEEDGQPHTLTINPGPAESSYQDTLLTTSQITTIPGHTSHTQAYFDKIGIYTYWCIVHPETMVGLIYVNATVNTTVPSVHYANYSNKTLDLLKNNLTANGILYPTIALPANTLLNLTVKDPSSSNYTLRISSGSKVDTSNYTTVINETNKSRTVSIPFNQTGEYVYWNSINTSRFGIIYIYSALVNISLYADLNGWNFSKSSGVNPTINITAGTLVNFTLINEDNLTHVLEVNPGNYENSSTSTPVASVNSTIHTSQGYYLFMSTRNYTYWDLYHPSTAAGIINVSNSSSSSASISYVPGTESDPGNYIFLLGIQTRDEHYP
jgi:plastocyanin